MQSGIKKFKTGLILSLVYVIGFNSYLSGVVCAAKTQEKNPLSAADFQGRLDQLEVRLKRCFRYAELCKDAGEDVAPVIEIVRRAAKAISENNLDLAEKSAGEAELFLTGSAEPIPPKLVRFPSPDQGGWMHADVTYFILEHKLEGKDTTQYEKELREIEEYGSKVSHEDQLNRIREVLRRLFKLLRKLDEPERQRAIRSRIQNADPGIIEIVRKQHNLFLEKLRPKLPSTDPLIIEALDKKYRIAVEFYRGGRYKEVLTLLEEAGNMVQKAGKGLSLAKLLEIEKLPGAKALDATGKVIAPQKDGYYLSLFMPPMTFGEKSMAALTGSHFASVYLFATWRPFMRGTIDESVCFGDWWDIDQALYLRDGWRAGKVAMTFRQYLDLLNLYGAVPYIGWSPRAGGWSEFQPRYNLPAEVPRLQEIIEGRYDDYIAQFARQIKDWGKPLFIEFSAEMNGNAQPHSAPCSFGPNGETPVEDIIYPTRWWRDVLGLPHDPSEPNYELLNNQYGDPNLPDGPERVRDAWRHIHDIFDQEGVSNVTWATHTPSGIGGQFPGTAQAEEVLKWGRWENFWPGDNYIDWGGTSAYFGNAPAEAKAIPGVNSFDITVEWSYKDFHNSSWKNKPFGAPEFHYDGPPEKAVEIYAQIFGKILPDKFPRISLFNYAPNDIGGFVKVPGLARGWEKAVTGNPRYRPYPEFNPDHTPPGKITDLKVEVIKGGIKLFWTASGDDGNTGTAARYIIKYRTERISSGGGVEKDFLKEPWRLWSAQDTFEISNPPKPALGATKQEMISESLKPGIYWFAIQSVDDVGYNSKISNVIEVVAGERS